MESKTFPYASYTGRLLRVNLHTGICSVDPLDPALCKTYLGGLGLGAYILYREVPSFIGPYDSRNRIALMTGPLVGTALDGAVTASFVTVSALSGGAVTTNMNGILARKLKAAGYDGIILEGISQSWVYLHIDREGRAALKDARDLLGTETWDCEQALRQLYGDRARKRSDATVAVACIGPAGENLVRFAGCYGGWGHSASKGGIGSVIGAKRLKAIVIGPLSEELSFASVSQPQRMEELARSWRFWQRRRGMGAFNSVHGWFGGTFGMQTLGIPPIKNLTSSDFEKWYANYTEENIRSLFQEEPDTCPTCDFNHCNRWTFRSGRYSGMVVDEIEYDTVAAFGPNLGITNPEDTVYLAQVADRLGLEYSELTFTLGLLMECYEKELINKSYFDGEPLVWGDSAAVERLMRKIAHREGCGDRFAEGVWRTACEIGKGAPDLAVCNRKGHSPQVHDNRTAMMLNFAEIVTEVGHYQSMTALKLPGKNVASFQVTEGLELPGNLRQRSMFKVAPEILPTFMFLTQLHDLLGTCIGHSSGQSIRDLTEALNAATGMELTSGELLGCAERFINLLRLFNLSRGLGANTDMAPAKLMGPSGRQPLADKPLAKYFDDWKRRYYEKMGWDERGVPRPETLRRLGLEWAIPE